MLRSRTSDQIRQFNNIESAGELLRFFLFYVFDSWQYGDSLNAAKSTWFQDIYSIPDGYLVSAANSLKYGTDSAQTAIVYLSRSGEILKYNRFNLPSGNSRFTSSAIFPAAGGGYMVAQTGNSTPHIFWQKVDAYGSPVWSTETVLTGVQSVSKMIQNADSSFTIVGSNNNHALLLTVLPGSPTSCYDQPANPGFTNPLLSKVNWASQGDQFLKPDRTDTTFTSFVLHPSRSELICPGNGNCYNIYNVLCCAANRSLFSRRWRWIQQTLVPTALSSP